MEKKRKDHSRYLLIGFSASLLVGILFFVLSGVITVHDTKKLVAEAGNAGKEAAGNETPAETETPAASSAEESESERETEDTPKNTETPTETEPVSEDPPDNPAVPSYSDGTVQALSPERIAEIESTVDMTLRGFGTGFTDPKNELGRPTYVTSVEQDMQSAGINGRCFCSDANTKRAAITFQAGYESGHTAEILSILAEYGISSTFYITHEYGWNNPDLVRAMIDQGHEIGNHSYSAPEEGIALQSLQAQMDDALRMQSYMQDTFGYTMSKYNFNSGIFTLGSAKMMSDMGYEVCFCSVNYDDFSETAEFDANSILNSLLSCAHNGVVYCFHVNNKVTPEFLPGLIHYLRSEGYEIVRMP